MIRQIISGGQTGVDQAALEIAVTMNISIAGWCPKGGIDANGNNILSLYPLKETATSEPSERTQLNIDDSDGTLIIVPTLPLPNCVIDGTRLTMDYAIKANKPHFVISLDNANAVNEVLGWLKQCNISLLNIAGPREDSWPGIFASSKAYLHALFQQLG